MKGLEANLVLNYINLFNLRLQLNNLDNKIKDKMLSKAFATTYRQMLAKPNNLMPLATRGVYTAETMPYVFINKHTKVLVQGMTGKHVSTFSETPIEFLRVEPNQIFLSSRLV